MEPDKKDRNRQKITLTYLLAMAGIACMYAEFVPKLMDWYTVRPAGSFADFYLTGILDGCYRYEGVILWLLLAALYCITANGGASLLILSAAVFALTHASYLKLVNRRELLRLSDLKLTEAAGMAAGYIRFSPDAFLGMFAGGLLLLTALGFLAEYLCRRMLRAAGESGSPGGKNEDCGESGGLSGKNEDCGESGSPGRKSGGPGGKKLWLRALSTAAFLALAAFYNRDYMESRMSFAAVDAVDPVKTEKSRYVLYQFLRDDLLTSYNLEDTRESYAWLRRRGEECAGERTETESFPDVIVIMNESWWDTDLCDPQKVTFSRDPMEPVKSLGADCSRGYLTSNVYGGGTVSSEAEFLTGLNTKYYVGDSGVYSYLRERKAPSVVDYFHALDYEAIAIHPYFGSFYSRDQVWEKMGFDRILFEEDMHFKTPYTHYISDDSLADEIIREYENAGSDRRFIWATSIANHGLNLDYPKGDFSNRAGEYDYPVEVDGLEGVGEQDRQAFVNYVNGIYLAGRAYEKLTRYFSERTDPVVLVMFGDHIPNFSQEAAAGAGIGRAEQFASVPVALWSNFPGEALSFQGESVFYLPEIVLEYAGLPDSDMTRILRYERSLFRTNARAYTLDGEGRPVEQCTREQAAALKHSQIVEYDILFGKESPPNLWLP